MAREEFTIKNRPRELEGSKPNWTHLDEIDNFQNQIRKTEEWFEGFEKTLPEKLDRLAAWINNWIINSQGVAVSPALALTRRIIHEWAKTEILGSEPE